MDEQDFAKAAKAALDKHLPAVQAAKALLKKGDKTATKALREARQAAQKAKSEALKGRPALRKSKAFTKLEQAAALHEGLSLEQLTAEVAKWTAELRGAKKNLDAARHALSKAHSKAKVERLLAGASESEKEQLRQVLGE